MIFLIIGIAVACAGNAKRAAQKGLNGTSWGIATFFAFLLGIFLACILLCCIMLGKYPQLSEMMQSQDRNAMNEFIRQNFEQNDWLYSILIFGGGVGGYLVVRRMIERKKIRLEHNPNE